MYLHSKVFMGLSKSVGPQVFIIFGQQCSAASTWRCLGSLVATTASDAKSTTYNINMHILLMYFDKVYVLFSVSKHQIFLDSFNGLRVGSSIALPPRGAAWGHYYPYDSRDCDSD
uniref:Uncharacterized protein n=1 Tax=Amphimedon queenslandica TaxID=400682 RepID=A0A1X7U4P9_AMPQE